MTNEEKQLPVTEPKEKKKSKASKYLWNIIFVFALAGIAGYLSLKDNFNEVMGTLKTVDFRYVIFILIALLTYYAIDGLIIYILARLYTTRYKIHRGIAVSLIGQFYSNITPSASGGQFAQAYTMKKQKVEVSSAASILVMHFIIFQIVLVLFGIVAMIFKFNVLIRDAAPIKLLDIDFPVWVLALIGFIINGAVIGGLLLMSYSKRLHQFIINKGVALFHKLKLVRDPEKTSNNLRLTTENFRIELRRLQSNIPVTLLIALLFICRFAINYSMPYIVGKSLGAPMTYIGGQSMYVDSVFLNGFLQMITGLVPLPGAAGISEYMFERLYAGIFIFGRGDATMDLALLKSAQLLWRFFTFYFVLIVGGLVSAFYHSRMEDETDYQFSSKTFVDIQRETIEIRKATSETMYQTASFSTKEIDARMKKLQKDLFGDKKAKRAERKKKKEDKKTKKNEKKDVSVTPVDNEGGERL